MLMLCFFCVKQGVSQKEFPWLIIMHTPVSNVALMHQAAIFNCILVAHFLLYKNKAVIQPRGAVLYHTTNIRSSLGDGSLPPYTL